MTKEEVKRILENHKHWFNADLEDSNLHDAIVKNTNFYKADLSETILEEEV